MFRKVTLTVCLIACCVWCLVLAARADSSQAEAGRTEFESVASVEALMFGQKTFFKQLNAAVQDTAYPERSHAIEAAAEVLAELANINSFKSEKPDYRAWARQLRDTALKLAREADKEQSADEGQMSRLLAQMGETCSTCHDTYQ